MTTALNIGAWCGVTAASLWGASRIVGSLGHATGSVLVFFWNGGTGNGWNVARFKDELKESRDAFAYGAAWVGAAFLARQVVARLFSAKPPVFLTNGLAILGWQQIRSPLVDKVVNRLERFLPFNITVY